MYLSHQCLPSGGVTISIGKVEGPTAIVSAATVQVYIVNGFSAVTFTLVAVVLMTLASPAMFSMVTR